MALMYVWRAEYIDGTADNQYNDDGTEVKFGSIKFGKLSRFLLLDRLGQPAIVLHMKPHQRLIYRRRVAIHTAIGPTGKQGVETVYIVGWQETKRVAGIFKVNVQAINFLFEDGHVESMDRFDPKSKQFYGLGTPNPWEK